MTSPPPRGLILTGPYRGMPRRPRPDRTRGLVLDHMRQLLNSAAYAESIGRPLNAMLTIRWIDAEGFSPERWPKSQSRLLDKMARWLQQRGIAPAFLWARERVRGSGCHSHVLLFLGRQPLAVAADLRAYLTRAGGFRSADGVDVSMGRFGALTPDARAGLRRYLAKGFDHRLFRYVSPDGETENLGAVLGLEHRGSQGFIEIKRAGVSQSIGPKARADSGWQEVKDLVGLHRLLHYESNSH